MKQWAANKIWRYKVGGVSKSNARQSCEGRVSDCQGATTENTFLQCCIFFKPWFDIDLLWLIASLSKLIWGNLSDPKLSAPVKDLEMKLIKVKTTSSLRKVPCCIYNWLPKSWFQVSRAETLFSGKDKSRRAQWESTGQGLQCWP